MWFALWLVCTGEGEENRLAAAAAAAGEGSEGGYAKGLKEEGEKGGTEGVPRNRLSRPVGKPEAQHHSFLFFQLQKEKKRQEKKKTLLLFRLFKVLSCNLMQVIKRSEKKINIKQKAGIF